MFRNKLRASLIHLLLSILLVALIIGSILFFFFPKIFIGISDFKEISTIIISVDLILGPILTFVVFQPGKKSLKFDLSVIASIQLTALIYGGYALFQAHPVFITFNVDRFTVVTARDAEPENAQYDEYRITKLATAKLAFADFPTDIDKKNELMFESTMGGKDLDQRVDYYKPYKNNIDKILSRSLDQKVILAGAEKDKNIKEFLKNHNIEDYAFLPFTSQSKDAIIVLDKLSAQPVATIDSDPWILSER